MESEEPQPKVEADRSWRDMWDTYHPTMESMRVYVMSLGLLVLVWLVGYWGFSVTWVMLGLFIWMWREKKIRKKNYKIQTARGVAQNEQSTILSCVQDLPSWVYFPDVEKAEWLNKILAQVWPNLDRYVEETLRLSVEPAVQQANEMLKSFQFSKIDLGDEPPRVAGVQVYTEYVKKNEIVMDMDLMYSGDCDIEIRIKRFLAGVQDLQVQGTVRVVMKPLMSQHPLVGGITVFFLNRPEINFNLSNIGEVLNFPGLSSLLKGVVADQVAAFMVLPNRFPIPLVPDLDTSRLRYPMPKGVLRIQLKEAKQLMSADPDFFTKKGKSDPYCILHVGAQLFKSKTIQRTLEPKWNQYFEAVVYEVEGQTMQINVFDEDPGVKDDPLGNATVSVGQVAKEGFTDVWLPLEDAKSGQVRLRMTWLGLSSQREALEKMERMKRVTDMDDMSSALLFVRVDSATGLPPKKKVEDVNTYVELTMGKQHEKSWIQWGTDKPVWGQGFTFLLKDPHSEELLIEIKEERSKKTIGKKIVPVATVLEKMKSSDPVFLEGPKGVKIEMKMELILRILSSDVSEESLEEEEIPLTPTMTTLPSTPDAGPSSPLMLPEIRLASISETELSSTPDSPVTPVPKGEAGQLLMTIYHSLNSSKVLVTVHKARNLLPPRGSKVCDAYVRMRLCVGDKKSEIKKTSAVKENLNPAWDETLGFPASLAEAKQGRLEVAVKHKRSLLKSFRGVDSWYLGDVEVDLSNVEQLEVKGQPQWFDLKRDVGARLSRYASFISTRSGAEQ
ncbi:PREDICTED: extended synaptotagmin-2-like [Branchiostoma belcheri]|uniref:Extended synaptotagmin-2-like n=1 Tax=Branchiostoma belcheri TaxID=7741 RepID=A0A6P4YW93_BRABE|nr:PREDICTED: extended synaptotagmin-2-like [Branchiostoma belcheri]